MPSWVWSDNLTGYFFLPLDQGFTVELLLILLEEKEKKNTYIKYLNTSLLNNFENYIKRKKN